MRIVMLLHKSVQFDSRVRREASSLAATGHDVVVLELAQVPDREVMLDGFRRVSSLPPDWMRHRLPAALYRALTLLYFVRGIVRTRPDAVHAHDAAMLLPGAAGAFLTRALLIYDSHELATSVPYRERWWAWLVATIERLLVPRSTAVITVSDGIAERLRERYRLELRPTVVRNVSALTRSGDGSDGEHGLRARLGIGIEVPLVLHQGAPAPDRGCEVLVAATALVDGVHVAFLGDPEPGYESQLRAAIERDGVGDRVTLLPSIPLEQLLAYTAEADVGVTLLQDTCENHRLALPNKLFEYIAAGVPVIASALPETEALIRRYGVGWCVAPADPQALAGAIRTALAHRDNPELRRRLAHARSELRWEREQQRLIDLYDRLAASSG